MIWKNYIIATIQIILLSQVKSIDGIINQLKSKQNVTQNGFDQNSQFIKQIQESCKQRFNEILTDDERTIKFKQEELNIINLEIRTTILIYNKFKIEEFKQKQINQKKIISKQQVHIRIRKSKSNLSQFKRAFDMLLMKVQNYTIIYNDYYKIIHLRVTIKFRLEQQFLIIVQKPFQIIDEIVEIRRSIKSRIILSKKEQIRMIKLQTLANPKFRQSLEKQKLCQFQNDVEHEEKILIIKNKE
ncbi:unnamed protein product [Paramecium sonneborni]|uniref:Transmembrane protein n=1 Tax=Paramecium sonneborni TaxID=65129 RepID=A0A8S1MMA5_9CILI|nr:unnamed protein product [Paramecium sonneborni]